MVSFRPRLARIIGHRWPIALILTASMAGVILAVITVTAVLEIRQERNLFRQELETRGRLLADTLNDTLADPLYFLDVDEVEDITGAVEMSQDALPYIQVFRPDGTLLTDTSSPNDARSNLAPGFVRTVIQSEEPVLEFHGDDLEVTSPIKAGNQLVGIVHFDLSTASLNGQLTDITWGLIWQGLALFAVAALLAFAVARYVTRPLRALGTAALSIGSGNLDEQVLIDGPEETASLGQALDSMRTELKGLYQNLEGQVANRTQELSQANESLETEIVDRKRLAQESQLMAEIGQVISSSVEIEEVYERFAELVRGNLPFDRIAINTVDLRQGTLTVVQVAGMEIPNLMAGICMPVAGTFTEQVIQSPEGVIFQPDNLDQPDSLSLVLTPFFQAGCCSFLGVPLIYRGETIAILNLASAVPQAYSPQHLVLTVAIGQQIAGAIANAQLYEAQKRTEEAEHRAAEESAALVEIGRVITSSLDMNEVFEVFARQVGSLITFDQLEITVIDQGGERDEVVFSTALSNTPNGFGESNLLEGSLTGIVALSRAGLIIQGMASDEVESEHPCLQATVRAGFHSWLVVPLIHRDESIGALFLASRTETVFTQRVLDLAQRIANQISGSIANAQLFAHLRRAEEALRSSEERFRQMAENVREVFFLVDHDNYEVLYINRAFEKVWGRTRESLYEQPSIWLDAIHPEDFEMAYKSFEKLQATGEFDEEFRIIRPDRSIRWVHAYVIPIRSEPGQFSRRVGIAEDVTERRQAEDKIKASLQEKEVLLKEINHRVKNNLQIISSLLNLQSRDIHDEQALRAFQVSQDRIRAMAMVHEKLYQSEDLARIDFGEYIESLATDLGSSYGFGLRVIDLKIDVENILLGVDRAIPCGVIVNELVANSLKHAFPGNRSGQITVSFQAVDGQYRMIFKDDGVGFPEDLDISRPSSLGLTIVNALTGQLGGTIDLGRNGGSEISITFPVTG